MARPRKAEEAPVETPPPADGQATGAVELASVSTALVEFDKVGAGIATLQERYAKVLYPVETTAGMKEAVKARAELREVRLNVEAIRKQAKAPILELGRKLDAAAKRITGEVEALECPIDDQIKAREAQLEAERKAKAEAEAKRVEKIMELIRGLHKLPEQLYGQSADAMQQLFDSAQFITIGPEYMEFSGTAEEALVTAKRQMKTMLDAQRAVEDNAERLRLEREELERQRAEEAARAAETRAQWERERAEQAAKHAATQAEIDRQRALLARDQEAARIARADAVAAEMERLRREEEAAAIPPLAQAVTMVEADQPEPPIESTVADAMASGLPFDHEPGYMPADIETHLVHISTAVYHRNEMNNPDVRNRLRWYMSRWTRALDEWDQEQG